ncbi:MAG TPA: hypothetical protein VF658_14750 [Pyrinomonadaceae bacterium]
MKLPLNRTTSAKGGRVKSAFRPLMLCLVVGALISLPMLSSASAPLASLTIVNNSSWQIDNIYLSPVDQDNWGADQLEGSVLSPGASHTLNLSCDQGTIKVITEDSNGCFLSQVVSCAGGTWTITNDASPDCGN